MVKLPQIERKIRRELDVNTATNNHPLIVVLNIDVSVATFDVHSKKKKKKGEREREKY